MYRSPRRRIAFVLTLAATVVVGCGIPNKAGRERAIEAAITDQYGGISIRCCGQMSLDQETLAFLKRMEAAGLVTVREIPQAYWDSFLSRTQGTGRPFEIAATQRFKQIVGIKPDDADQDVAHGGLGVTFTIQTATIDKVVTDEEYRGPLASPGETHRLVLGVYTATPNSYATALGPAITPQAPKQFRFRCVARYSGTKKDWSIVALDAGSLDPERWFTNNVR